MKTRRRMGTKSKHTLQRERVARLVDSEHQRLTRVLSSGSGEGVVSG